MSGIKGSALKHWKVIKTQSSSGFITSVVFNFKYTKNNIAVNVRTKQGWSWFAARLPERKKERKFYIALKEAGKKLNFPLALLTDCVMAVRCIYLSVNNQRANSRQKVVVNPHLHWTVIDWCYDIILSVHNKILLHISMVIPPEGIWRSKFTISQVTEEANYSKNTVASFLHFMSLQTLCPYWFSGNCRMLAPADCDITATFSQHWENANYCGRLSPHCFATFYLQECCRYDAADGSG